MTSLEFSNEFDILYNSVASNASPGFDLYEKSVYLTKAQAEIVKNYYDPTSNSKQKGFENSEKRRHDLKSLIRDYKQSALFPAKVGISTNSLFCNIPLNIFVAIQEQVKIINKDLCNYGQQVNVVPITHDEYNIQKENPFKKPDKNTVWRMDYSNIGGGPVVELITSYTQNDLEYQLRYLRNPSPIILTDLSVEFPNDNLTINNVSDESLCQLHEMTQIEILDRAVELALRDYKAQGLEAKVQLNTRNE